MRYQIILSAIIILTSVTANFRSHETKADWPLNLTYLTESASIGLFIGVIGLILSRFDSSFALGMTFSVASAITVAMLFEYVVVMLLKRFRPYELRGEFIVVACGDFVRSFTLLGVSYVIFHVVAPVSIGDDDIC